MFIHTIPYSTILVGTGPSFIVSGMYLNFFHEYVLRYTQISTSYVILNVLIEDYYYRLKWFSSQGKFATLYLSYLTTVSVLSFFLLSNTFDQHLTFYLPKILFQILNYALLWLISLSSFINENRSTITTKKYMKFPF